ncbi:unnamed protein product [Phytophthora lilii]|uniref:Unnamed protein product n=1 Tax=Phytophthora lilii TaxID=2077276 RepID=A0A9W6TKM1_9STRA|nr:unnamed protein product [Phytophthora lilii]
MIGSPVLNSHNGADPPGHEVPHGVVAVEGHLGGDGQGGHRVHPGPATSSNPGHVQVGAAVVRWAAVFGRLSSFGVLWPQDGSSLCGHHDRVSAASAELELDYRNIAGSVKTRFENEQFIELFDVDLVTLPQQLPLWFTVHQRLMEEERIALTKGEFFPGRSPNKLEEQPQKDSSPAEEADAKVEEEDQPESDAASPVDPTPAAEPVLAYQKYFFYLQGPLVSSSVKFSEKKSIIGDDDDD